MARFEICRAGKVLEVLETSDESAVIARAFELKGLPYIVHHARFSDDVLKRFACVEDGDSVIVTTPIGQFRLAARRARKGEQASEVRITGTTVGFGVVATEDQLSPAVELCGRLNLPSDVCGWTFQPSHFVYEDGTNSGFLGSYPRNVEWIDEPTW
jgi:hypothetical protein